MELNILLTSIGRRVPLTQALVKAYKVGHFSGKIITIDMDPLSPGIYVGDVFYLVPHSSHPDYLPTLLKICRKEKVKYIIPTTDSELEILAYNRKFFEHIGTKVLVSSYQTVKISNDKLLTYRFLVENGFPTPRTYLGKEIKQYTDWTFPLFIKPRCGRGSVKSYPVENEKELDFFLYYVPDPIVQEFARGQEYTVDVLADLKGEIISIVPRQRITTIGGVSQKGKILKDWRMINLVYELTKKLNIIGPANIQLFKDGDNYQIIEINARFSGGIPLTIAAGADFPLLLLKILSGQKVVPQIGDFDEEIIMLRYDGAIFIRNEKMISGDWEVCRALEEGPAEIGLRRIVRIVGGK